MLQTLVLRFTRDRSGATAIEYGLIAALLAIVVLAAVGALGPSIKGLFEDTATTIDTRSLEPAPDGSA